jgi:hypothetical protein
LKQISAKISKFFCWKKPLELPSFVPPRTLSLTKKKKKKEKKKRENSSFTKAAAGRANEKGRKMDEKNSSSIHQLHKL